MKTPSTSELLHVRHRTHYSYAFPVRFEPHRLVLRPREGHDLRVEQHDLEIWPEARRIWTRDIFGNSITHAFFSGEPVQELIIESRLIIKRMADWDEPDDISQCVAPQMFDYDTLEHNIITGYLTPVYPEETEMLQPWIQQAPHPAEFSDNWSFVNRLNETVHKTVEYRRREEKGVQTPATTISLGSGSCRDMANLLMEVLRHQGVASRFVSGYLDCSATRAAQGSTHAWTEVYFPQRGWLGFDPTTGKPCDHNHVVIGTSHHPRGVMPVTGRFFGPENAFRSLTVGVNIGPATSEERDSLGNE